MAGRKPKPTSMKIAEGNPSKRAIKPHLSYGVAAPQMPHGLSASEQIIWHETCQLLRVTLETVDGALLESYVTNLDRMRRMRVLIDKYGETYESETKSGVTIRVRPEVSILMQSEKLHRQYCSELGLTPASRVRMPDPNQKDLFGNQWEEFGEKPAARH